jgi:dTDP-4-dehydrorhamnose reductase
VTAWLVTGAGGLLGRELVAALAGRRVVAATRAELDITEASQVDRAVSGVDVVVNAAAWTDVDGAETRPLDAMAANGHGPAVLARACRHHGVRLLHVSTDYVFAGDPVADPRTAPAHHESDPPAPRTQYGIGKLVGEQAVLGEHPEGGYVVRTAWLYGEYGRNFVRTMLELERTRAQLEVVDDQWGQPTWARELAARLIVLGTAQAPPGVYQITGAGRTTWCGFARAVFAAIGADPARVYPTTTGRFPRPAPRPAFGVLGHERMTTAGLAPMPDWAESVRAAAPLLASSASSGR